MKKKIIIAILLTIILSIGLTYAWWDWIGSNNNVNFTMNGISITYNGGTNISGIKLLPVSTKEKGITDNTAIYKEINVSSTSENKFNLYLDINTINSGLKNETLKWEIYKGNVLINNGNFKNANANDTINLMLHETINSTNSLYKLYIWIDGTIDNPIAMESQNYNFTLRADANNNPNEYVLTLDSDGGNNLNNKMFIYKDQTYGTLPTPTKTGYTFQGWSMASNEFIPVDFIKSSGTQYIDTGYYWQHENIEIYFDGTVLSNSSNQSLFGNEENITSSGTTRYFAGIPHGSNGNYSIYIGTGAQGTVSATVGTRFTLDIKTENGHLYIYKNGANVIDKTFAGSVMTHDNAYLSSNVSTTVGNIFLFANHNTSRGANNAAIQYIGEMRVYAFKLYDNGVLVRNLIPCYRKTNNAAGMYDTVNNVFYPNLGSGSFTYGSTNYITSSSTVTLNNDHTLTAIWQAN